SLRTKGVYFIMVTLAFAQMAYFVFHDTHLAGGSDGIFLYAKPRLELAGRTLLDLDKRRQLYYAVIATLIASYALLALLRRSRFGHALAGIRVNEPRMRAAGFATFRYKLAAFVIAGALAGLAGFLLAAKDGVVNPELLGWHESGTVLLMVILGGIGSLRGAVIGAVAFTLLKELYQSEALLGPLAEHWQLSLGLTIIAFVALLPKGLVGLAALVQRRSHPVEVAGHG
ncbi:MAG TPA: branched-chain amino acid ABC transporter permease, partial [Luteimonas sp.]|nr:branched-chain amino acid ABC transporter permease [Luteimonas sp.]